MWLEHYPQRANHLAIKTSYGAGQNPLVTPQRCTDKGNFRQIIGLIRFLVAAGAVVTINVELRADCSNCEKSQSLISVIVILCFRELRVMLICAAVHSFPPTCSSKKRLGTCVPISKRYIVWKLILSLFQQRLKRKRKRLTRYIPRRDFSSEILLLFL